MQRIKNAWDANPLATVLVGSAALASLSMFIGARTYSKNSVLYRKDLRLRMGSR